MNPIMVCSFLRGATALQLNGKLVTYNVKHFKWVENIAIPDEIMGSTFD
jgi:hypothetical protein